MNSTLSLTVNPPTVPTVLLTDFAPLVNVIQFFLGLDGATIVSLSALTRADVVKPKATYAALGGELLKLSRFQGKMGNGVNYATTVNHRLKKEGKTPDFIAQPRKWGERIKGTPFVSHKGKLYVEIQPFRSLSTAYIVNGEVPRIVRKEDIAQYLTPVRPSKLQADAGLTDHQVIVRDFRIDRLREIRAMGGAIVQRLTLQQAIANALSE